MKRRFLNALTILLAFYLFLCGMVARAQTLDSISDLWGVFSQHGSVMLLIDPDSGDIVDANNAATVFYGYAKEQVLSMRISDINMPYNRELERSLS